MLCLHLTSAFASMSLSAFSKCKQRDWFKHILCINVWVAIDTMLNFEVTQTQPSSVKRPQMGNIS